ncbi:MAG: sugar phosphate isomerase/epimerase [Symploca sp. SIO2B6]|nr:sugar phosphate isomerase/epimerase [Symploca sp. SIO2B6]
MKNPSSLPDIFLSFFMFTTDMKPNDTEYRKLVVSHIKALQEFGYTGFEFPIKPTFPDNNDFVQDIQSYIEFRGYLNSEKLDNIKIATNVGATRTYDPTSPFPEQREKALAYLKSRVDITAHLYGNIMMGPIIVPYGGYFTDDFGTPIWSDALQDLLAERYRTAQPVLNELGKYAEAKGVKLAIEPITHWEQPGPNKLSQLIEFLDGVESKQVGVVIDGAHETLDGDGPEIFKEQVAHIAEQGRLHYIQVSPPDRGALHTSWFPWQSFLAPVLQHYDGPIAVEIFNAIPDFLNSMRLTRRKFWIPGEDAGNSYPNAYDIADKAIQVTQQEVTKILEHSTC